MTVSAWNLSPYAAFRHPQGQFEEVSLKCSSQELLHSVPVRHDEKAIVYKFYYYRIHAFLVSCISGRNTFIGWCSLESYFLWLFWQTIVSLTDISFNYQMKFILQKNSVNIRQALSSHLGLHLRIYIKYMKCQIHVFPMWTLSMQQSIYVSVSIFS